VVVSLAETVVKVAIACALLRCAEKRIWVERHEGGWQEEVALQFDGEKRKRTNRFLAIGDIALSCKAVPCWFI
jgi:hypothetical protein